MWSCCLLVCVLLVVGAEAGAEAGSDAEEISDIGDQLMNVIKVIHTTGESRVTAEYKLYAFLLKNARDSFRPKYYIIGKIGNKWRVKLLGSVTIEITFSAFYPYEPPRVKIYEPQNHSMSGEDLMQSLKIRWTPARTMTNLLDEMARKID